MVAITETNEGQFTVVYICYVIKHLVWNSKLPYANDIQNKTWPTHDS